MKYIKNLNDINRRDINIAGGKGASLGELIKSKINVPDGYVILTCAFDKFIKDTNVIVKIDSALDSINPKDINSVKRSSEIIESAITSKEIPEEVLNEILLSYERLNTKFVAVRSSATSEDNINAAWAGQLNTYLNTTKKDLIINIKKCWASLFTPRALLYRIEKKLNNKKISVGVIIQKMINSEESGVAFSVHPLTKNKNHIVIEACFGLGEAIVSGEITPDRYVLDKANWNIIDININDKIKGLYRDKNGINNWKKLKKRGRVQVLSKNEIIRLGKLIKKIEQHTKMPIDIEWAKVKNKFFILQSRPITTLLE